METKESAKTTGKRTSKKSEAEQEGATPQGGILIPSYPFPMEQAAAVLFNHF